MNKNKWNSITESSDNRMQLKNISESSDNRMQLKNISESSGDSMQDPIMQGDCRRNCSRASQGVSYFYCHVKGSRSGVSRETTIKRYDDKYALYSTSKKDGDTKEPELRECFMDGKVLDDIGAVFTKNEIDGWNQEKDIFHLSSQYHSEEFAENLALLEAVIEPYLKDAKPLPGLLIEWYGSIRTSLTIYVSKYIRDQLYFKVINDTPEDKTYTCMPVIKYMEGGSEVQIPFRLHIPQGEVTIHPGRREEYSVFLAERLKSGIYELSIGAYSCTFEIGYIIDMSEKEPTKWDILERPELMPGRAPTCYRDDYAKKEFTSRDIRFFITDFSIKDIIDDKRSGGYRYKISKGEGGAYMLEAKGIYEHTMEIGREQVMGVQEIFEKFNLVKQSGIYAYSIRRNFCSPRPLVNDLYIIYETGERFRTCVDACWRDEANLAFRDYFDDLFTGAGYTDTRPSREAVEITRFTIEFKDGDYNRKYCFGTDADGERYFRVSSYNRMDRTFAHREAKVTEALTAGLHERMKAYNLLSFHAGNLVRGREYEEGHFPIQVLHVHVVYANGRELNGNYEGANHKRPEEMDSSLPVTMIAEKRNHFSILPEEWELAQEPVKRFFDEYLEENPK